MINLKFLIRNLFKNKAPSIITIAGFSVSISIALVLIAFLIKEFSIDKGFPKVNNICRVFANGNTASVREDFKEYFVANYPAIADACLYNNYTATVTSQEVPFNGEMVETDQSFFKLLLQNTGSRLWLQA